MRHPKECGPTGKLMYSEEEALREVKNTHRKYTLRSFHCRACTKFHITIVKFKRQREKEK